MEVLLKGFTVIAVFVASFVLLAHDRIENGEANVLLIMLVIALFPFFFFAIEDIMKEFKKGKKNLK